MTAILFDYPKSAVFARVLSKSKIYEHASPGSAVKELFVRQVEQISWQFKLAPETVNFKGTPSVPEIQIFTIVLKMGELKADVLRCIDQAIPFPIVFELRYEDKIKAIAAYKRANEADATKWVVSDYFGGEWISKNTQREPLPMVFDLDSLYARLLIPLMPYPSRTGENLQQCVKRMEEIRSKRKELDKCEALLQKEKQFNRKVEINAELHRLKQALDNLTALV